MSKEKVEGEGGVKGRKKEEGRRVDRSSNSKRGRSREVEVEGQKQKESKKS